MTTSRLLTGLVGEGYLGKNDEGLYLPGARLEHKGFCYGHAEDRQRVAAPVYRKGILVGSLLIGAPKDALTEEQLEVVGQQLAALSR